ncbi:MAG: O-antigen ligase family protein [Deltaproteobacteria bacterium]|nr:O-antigen ligase family protein [Deltaproteobacteria bacterium]
MERLEELIIKYRLTPVFLAIYLFMQPFKQMSGVRNTAFVLVLLIFILKLARKKVSIDFKDRTIQGLAALIVACVLSAALSPYPLDSFDFIRKNLAYQAVIFLVVITEFKTFDELKPVFYALIGGFAFLSILVLLNNNIDVLLHWLDEPNKGRPFLGGYSLYATFYIPLAVGYLYSSNDSAKMKGLIIFFIVLEFILSVLNNHRTQIVAFTAGVFLSTLLAKKYKVIAAGIIFCIISGVVILEMNPSAFDRYKTLLNPRNYVSNDHEGLNDRLAIWHGTVDMIEDRPIAGWGYGWKKLSWVARDKGYIEKWDKSGRTHLYFNDNGYGKANPHNLVLQILFEIGIIGLLAFLFFWATILYKSISVFGKRFSPPASFLKYGVTGMLLSYALINYTNGLWEESSGVLMMTFAACSFVLYRQLNSTAEEKQWH